MEDNHIKLHHNFSDGNPSVLTILHGEAQNIYDPAKVTLAGVITAPSEYYQKRKPLCHPDFTHVIFNDQLKSITLIVDEKDKFATVVQGQLIKNAFLEALSINCEKSYSIADLQKKLRFARRYFANPDDHKKLIVNLRNFTATITQTTQQSDDRAGNKMQHFESKVTDFTKKTDLAFTLKLPIFDGTDEENITIDVEVDVVNGTVALFLVSETLDEREADLRKAIFEKEKEIFKEIVIIQQ